MNFSEINTDRQLWDFMTQPSQALIDDLSSNRGPVILLGGSGKMGKELAGLIQNADRAIGKSRKIIVASTFSNPMANDMALLEKMGITCMKGDLSDEQFLQSLPDVPNVIYMMGFKFGSSGNWTRAFQLNSVVPYLIGRKYQHSTIVVFSSGNPYPHTDRFGQGSAEEAVPEPKGIYGWSIVARESSFRITAQQHPQQKIAFYRLMYAQHLNYGVLVDLAMMVWRGEPISLSMPAVNLVSQRDANEVAIRSLIRCSNDPWTINVSGPVWQVRDVVTLLEKHLGKKAHVLNDEQEHALLANDSLCKETFGDYRDKVEDMIIGAARWVRLGGSYWNRPTMFGQVNHTY